MIFARRICGKMEFPFSSPFPFWDSVFCMSIFFVFPKNRGVSPEIIHLNRVWNHYFHHPFWGKKPWLPGTVSTLAWSWNRWTRNGHQDLLITFGFNPSKVWPEIPSKTRGPISVPGIYIYICRFTRSHTVPDPGFFKTGKAC